MASSRVRTVMLSCLLLVPLAASILVPTAAEGAVSRCGASGSHTVCVTVPDGPFAGDTTITITNVKNSGVVISSWIPSGGAAKTLIQATGPYPSTNNYTFVWPTQNRSVSRSCSRVSR